MFSNRGGTDISRFVIVKEDQTNTESSDELSIFLLLLLLFKKKIQIGFLFRNYRLKGGFYVKDKKVYIISSLLCHRFAIKK